MKKMLMLLAVLWFTLTASAQSDGQRYVQVNGAAEMELVPDEIYLSITINERDSKGKITVEEQQREMIAALKQLGVKVAEQLTMVDLSSEFFKKNSSVATARYQLKLDSAAAVAAAWQALDRLGISQVTVERVDHSQLADYRIEVRKASIRAARQKAIELAEAIGQSVGSCIYIQDSNWDSDVAMKSNVLMTRATKEMAFAEFDSAVEEEQLEFQKIQLTYRVVARFALE